MRSQYRCRACDYPLRANENFTFTCTNVKCDRIGVIASAAMTMQVGELEAWLRHHQLSLSVSFSDRVYNADLRRPLGDGSSVSEITAKAAEFGVAVIAACESYERIHDQRTS